MRRLLAVVAFVTVWLLVLGTAARIPWSAPVVSRNQVTLKGQDFRPVMGAGVEDGSALGVGAIASDGNAMQSIPMDGLRAADYPLLTYQFEDFPRTLELLLVFRRADTPGDVQTVALPWPGDGVVTVDLKVATPAWRDYRAGFCRVCDRAIGTAEHRVPSVPPRPGAPGIAGLERAAAPAARGLVQLSAVESRIDQRRRSVGRSECRDADHAGSRRASVAAGLRDRAALVAQAMAARCRCRRRVVLGRAGCALAR
jgi:hypothetical protein